MGGKAELERFKKIGVYECVPRSEAMQDFVGKVDKLKWVRHSQGSDEQPEVCCGLVAREFRLGERLDEFFAGTPSRIVVVAEKDLSLILLHVKRAFLYESTRWNACIELPRQDPHHGDVQTGGGRQAMYGAMGRTQIWADVVREKMIGLNLCE